MTWNPDLMSLEPPHPWRLRSRGDLVPVLRAALADSDALKRTLYGKVATAVLPHIDSPQAAVMMLQFPRAFPEGLPMVWGFWPPPDPDDATSPPVWLSHVADGEVLSIIRERVRALGADERAQDTYSLAVLASSNDSLALDVLSSAFESKPKRAATYFENILHQGSLPIAQRPWNYFLSQTLPRMARMRPDSAAVYSTVMAWWKLAIQFGDKRIERVEHRDSLDVLGKAFVEMILSQPDAARLLYVIPGSPDYPTSDPFSWAKGYSTGCVRMFLETCAYYGDGTQAKELRSLFQRSEEWTRDPAVRRRWEAVEAHNSFAWNYESLRDDYLHRKEAAIHLMQLR